MSVLDFEEYKMREAEIARALQMERDRAERRRGLIELGAAFAGAFAFVGLVALWAWWQR